MVERVEESPSSEPVGDGSEPESQPAKEPAKEPVAKSKGRSRPNLPQVLVGSSIALVGAAVPFLIMASDRRWDFSVPVGLVGCLVAFFGISYALGTFSNPLDRVAHRADGTLVRQTVFELVTSIAAWYVCLRLAVAGTLKWPIFSAAVLVTGTFIWMVTAAFRAAQALGAFATDETGRPRPLLRRHGFWLIVLATVLYLPLLGSYSLSDPWETHYGEVAREMLARDDWVSLWWAQDGWFWSKPILDFWMQGLFFSALGVRYMPDQMLASAAQGRFPQPEWAARIGVFLLTIAATYFLYKAVAKVAGRRAGLVGGVVLTTMPYWYLISHQSMTDMLYVAPLSAAMGLLYLGFQTDDGELVKVYEIPLGKRTLRVSVWHLLFGAIVLFVLPQVLYLLSRNLTLHIEAVSKGFRWHADKFFSGSGAGNCGLPGNEPCREFLPVNRGFQPWHGALLWGGLGGALLWLNRGERRLSRIYFMAAWFFVAIAAMGKGAPGLVLPVFIALAYVGATRRWRDLVRAEPLALCLIVAAVALPWYVQMYMRHGQPFTDRLLFHDMYKRAFVHVHDTNVGDDVSFRYYVWQLGYGLFPWTGLAAAGLGWWLRRPNDRTDRVGDLGAFLALWFVAAFGMFTITLTKFHHYVFPVVPPTALLIGLMLDRALDGRQLPERWRLVAYLGGLGTGVTLLVYGVMRFFPGSISGRVYDGQPPKPVAWLGYLSIALAVVLLHQTIKRFGHRSWTAEPQPVPTSTPGAEQLALAADPDPNGPAALTQPNGTLTATVSPEARSYDAIIIAAVAIAAAVVIAVAGRDLFTTVQTDIEGQARLMHLFTYNYRRPWPQTLSFKAILTAFTIVPVALSLLFAVPRLRTHAAVMFLALSVLWTAWGIDVYLYKAAPHWGQRETILAYYKHRKSPDEPFVSYQMNWKGENFYTGNRTPAFVASGQKFKDWINEQQAKGVRAMYFTTEHGRMQSVKGEIGPHRKFEPITDEALNNKFFVGRAEF